MCNAPATIEHELYIYYVQKKHLKRFDLQNQTLTLGSGRFKAVERKSYPTWLSEHA